MLGYRPYYRRHLPHLQLPGATLFITFRLAGSLPRAVIEELAAERQRVEQLVKQVADPAERMQAADLEERRLFGRWDAALDTIRHGP